AILCAEREGKNDNNLILITSNNKPEGNKDPKGKYVKIVVKDPYNNRDIILKVSKKQKGVYIWESLDGKHLYVGHSINLYNRISSSALPTRPTAGRRYYSSSSQMNPWFLTGFLDGESSFYLLVHKSNSVKTGWSVRAVFETHLHLKDITLLEEIQTT
uniref:hypothetical protein n=1 Tax=Dematophora necatrix TaxID=2751867 RepID=UPI0030E55F11